MQLQPAIPVARKLRAVGSFGCGTRPQGDLIQIVDALLAAHLIELLAELGGKEAGELLSDRFGPWDACEAFDLGVPAFYPVI